MPPTLIVTHERRGHWAGQLRGRIGDRRVRWSESRSRGDLLSSVRGWPCPIVLLDLGANPQNDLESLARLAAEAPDALTLALEPEARASIILAAWDCGATHVWDGFAPPPSVAALVDRWVVIARRRSSNAGRPIADDRATPDLIETLLAL